MQVSIIIPIYNTGSRLDRCIESIISQTFIDFECLMVDDGSDKQTADLVDDFAAEYNRFIALHKENGGVSSARNYGLKQAKGDWIVFVDSDDSVTPDHLEKLMSAATEDVDIVMTGFKDVRVKTSWQHTYNKAKYIGIEGIKSLFQNTNFLEHQIPWDRAYRNIKGRQADCWQMKFDEKLSLSEDRLFCYNYLMHCRGIATIPDVTYIHDATDMNSLTYRKYPFSVNEYKYITFKKATDALKECFGLTKDDSKILDDYMESSYSLLINAYKDEGKMFSFYKTRILHKLGLL